MEIGAVKIAGDGTRVHWATWLGGSGNETPNCGIRVDDQKNVYLNFSTYSDDVPTTKQAHDRTYDGQGDAFVAKLNPDGSELLFGTYFGGSGIEEGNSTHNMALDQHGNAYLCTLTTSGNLPVTDDVFQRSMAGGKMDVAVAKFATSSGALLACTYIGGEGDEEPDGISVDSVGDVFFSGKTSSTDFPVSTSTIQPQGAGQHDATMTVISADFTQIKFSTYFGGASYEYGRASFLDRDGNLYLTGSTNGPGWPLHNAFQPQFAGGGGGKELCYEGGCYAGDLVLAKFTKIAN